MEKYEHNYGKNPEGVLSTTSGYATETTNFGEAAFGILNKSTRDKSNFTTPEVVSSSTATLFSVGNGSDGIRKNIIELKADGTVLISGVGGYDGTNPENATGIAESIDEIVSKVPQPDLTPLQTAIGSNTYEGSNYLTKETNLTDAVIQLDEEIKATNDNLALEHANAEAAYAKKTDVPTNVSQLTNNAGYQTETQVSAKVSALVDSAPEALNTLNKLAAALGDDPNFATTVTNQIAGKANAVHTHLISDVTDLQSALDKKATKEELNSKVSGTGVSSIQVVTALPDVQKEGVLYIVTGEEA